MNNRSHSMDTLFTFLLLLLFALFSLFLAAMGSSIYRKGVSHLNENYTSRTAIAYLTEKIRQHDSRGSISSSEVEGLPALCLLDEIDGQSYSTYIYFDEGSLKELFIPSERIASKSLGTSIVELESLTMDFAENALDVQAVSREGRVFSSRIPVNCSIDIG